MKYFQNTDVNFLKKWACTTLSKCMKVMTVIDKEPECKGTTPMDIMTHVETNTCYYCDEITVTAVVLSNTPEHRARNI